MKKMKINTAPQSEEANLIWNRYNAMIVANSISMAVLTGALSNDISNRGGFLISFMGVIIVSLWWLITSFGWHLLHTHLGLNGSDSKTYHKWRKQFSIVKKQDPIWWCAHLLIAVFYLAHCGFALHFLNESYLANGYVMFAGGIFLVSFFLLGYYTLYILDLKDAEEKGKMWRKGN